MEYMVVMEDLSEGNFLSTFPIGRFPLGFPVAVD